MSSIFKSSDKEVTSRTISIRPVGIKVESEENNQLESEKKQMQMDDINQKLNDALASLDATKKQTKSLMDQCKQQISTEREEWETEKEESRDLARQEGYLEGFQNGKDEALKKYESLIGEARRLIDIANQDYQSTLDNSEEVILELGLKMASKIINHELEVNDSYIELVKAVLEEVKDQPLISIFAHIEDYEVMLMYKDELMNIVSSKAKLSIYPDNNLNKGSCIVESPFGKIDAGVDSQLQEIRNHLSDLTKGENRERSRIS
ncbi:flagellar assembly protein FliH [Aquibacillus albus]|uniref:Flagellar assembly protein FliH n=1 Tax=Aquibacillus albus TaxID=1168171 RepID=A0ABS2N0Z7_9BACI|nr:flagellar assembly protein FliH [Aquibacillus albus]